MIVIRTGRGSVSLVAVLSGVLSVSYLVLFGHWLWIAYRAPAMPFMYFCGAGVIVAVRRRYVIIFA